METFVPAAAMGLLWLLVAGWIIGGTLCAVLVIYVTNDIWKTINIKRGRQDAERR